MTVPVLPPRKLTLPTAPVEQPEGPSTPPPPAVEVPAAETAQEAPSPAPAPTKKPSLKKAPKKPEVKKAAPKKAPVKKALPVKKAAPVKRAATENVVPKVPKISTRIWSEEAIELATLIVEGKKLQAAFPKTGAAEIRGATPRMQALLNLRAGIECKGTYSKAVEVSAIIKLLKRIPEELLPAKWGKAMEKIEKSLSK